jgi:uncharacterized protein
MAFRILSLDGGGSRSLIQILTLMDLYRSGGVLLTGHTVLAEFDLVIANSGGSLVLGGLIKDLPLGEIRNYFRPDALCRTLFAQDRKARGLLARLRGQPAGGGPRYATRSKFEGLRELLNGETGEAGIGDVTLDGLRTRFHGRTQFIITAFDDERRREILFRSDPSSAAASFAVPPVATLAEAIHASTTTPGEYFDAPAEISRGLRCWDGAMGGHHNPILSGLAEALASGVDPSEIEILSIGTGSIALPLASGSEDAATRKLVQERDGDDKPHLARMLDEDPADTASLMAHLALRQPVPQQSGETVSSGSVIRMNPLVQPILAGGRWLRPAGLAEGGDDSADEFLRLRRLPRDAVGEADVALIEKFCTLWHCDAVVNQPIRANADTLACEIGHEKYSEAKAQWLARTQTRPAVTGSHPAPLGQPFASSFAGREVSPSASAPRFAASRTG